MTQYTYKDIEEYLLDDDFFQWARYGFSDNGFSLESYKLRHPGCEEKIELAVAIVRSMKVVEDSKPTSQEYKMQSFNKMMSKLQQQPLQPAESCRRTLSYRRILPYPRITTYVASVAALLFICLGTYYILSKSKLQETTDITASVIDSLSRSGQVQIILDGKQTVVLDKNNAEIRVDEDGTVTVDEQLLVASRGEKVSVNQIVVPYGKRSKIILPDGSSLWINSGSCISYASNFAANRKLNVQGEVYLDVRKDAAHPFVVKTNRLEVTVLGTSFNVTDYAKDAETAVVLVRGSVDVTVDNKEKKRLVPNQRLSKENGAVKVDEVDVYNYICWKDDAMNFDGQKLSDVLKSLSRYYNTKIEISGSLKDEKYYGSLDLNCTLDEVLESISLATPLNIIRQGDEIYITPEK